jgi:hypothetical protein
LATSDKVYQLLAHGRWFSPGTLASSTTKNGRHDIAEILLKVMLKHKKSKIKSYILLYAKSYCIKDLHLLMSENENYLPFKNKIYFKY